MTDHDDLLRAVCEAWADTLGLDGDDVPLEEGFFDAGGNSLLLVLLRDQLHLLTGHDLRPTELFQHPTVLAQVELLAGRI